MRNVLIQSILKDLPTSFSEDQKNDVCKIICKYFNINDNSLTNKEALELYLNLKKIEGVSETSIARYRLELTLFLNFVGELDLQSISSKIITDYLLYRKNTLSENSLNDNLSIIRSFFHYLDLENYVYSNPCNSIKKIRTKSDVKLPFSPTDLTIIRENCESQRDKALIEFLYSTGCRVSEVVSVNIGDVDFNKKSLIVRGKGKKEREVFLTDNCILQLKRYIESRKDNSEALFLDRNENRLKKHSIEALCRRLENKCNIGEIHPHKFRRTLATDLLNKGVSLEVVSQILGHSKLSTTLVYCRTNRNNVENYFRKYCI